MIKYKIVETSNGRTQHWMNGKMVKKAAIPENILIRLEPGVELQIPSSASDISEDLGQTIDEPSDDTAQLAKKELPIDCLFCGGQATRKRFVNQQIANLCEEDYKTHTTGEIVAQIREVESQGE